MQNSHLTNSDKIQFIIENELKMTKAVLKGQKMSADDEFSEARKLIKQYRQELGLIRKD